MFSIQEGRVFVPVEPRDPDDQEKEVPLLSLDFSSNPADTSDCRLRVVYPGGNVAELTFDRNGRVRTQRNWLAEDAASWKPFETEDERTARSDNERSAKKAAVAHKKSLEDAREAREKEDAELADYDQAGMAAQDAEDEKNRPPFDYQAAGMSPPPDAPSDGMATTDPSGPIHDTRPGFDTASGTFPHPSYDGALPAGAPWLRGSFAPPTPNYVVPPGQQAPAQGAPSNEAYMPPAAPPAQPADVVNTTQSMKRNVDKPAPRRI